MWMNSLRKELWKGKTVQLKNYSLCYVCNKRCCLNIISPKPHTIIYKPQG